MQKEDFKTRLNLIIDSQITELVQRKPPKEQFMSYIDAKTVTVHIASIFLNALHTVPPEIKANLDLSEAVLAPSAAERIQILRSVVGTVGGAAGVAAALKGIFLALGVGTTVWTTILAFFTTVSVTGPIAWIVGGLTVTAIAGYFAFSGNPEKGTEDFARVLKSGLDSAIDAIWDKEEYKALSQKDLT